jgi:hypothetical protein
MSRPKITTPIVAVIQIPRIRRRNLLTTASANRKPPEHDSPPTTAKHLMNPPITPNRRRTPMFDAIRT